MPSDGAAESAAGLRPVAPPFPPAAPAGAGGFPQFPGYATKSERPNPGGASPDRGDARGRPAAGRAGLQRPLAGPGRRRGARRTDRMIGRRRGARRTDRMIGSRGKGRSRRPAVARWRGRPAVAADRLDDRSGLWKLPRLTRPAFGRSRRPQFPTAPVTTSPSPSPLARASRKASFRPEARVAGSRIDRSDMETAASGCRPLARAAEPDRTGRRRSPRKVPSRRATG